MSIPNKFRSHYLHAWDLMATNCRAVYHNEKHLDRVVRALLSSESYAALSGVEKEATLLAAIYHDVVYDPRSSTNEEESVRVMLDSVDLYDFKQQVVDVASELIMGTKEHSSNVTGMQRCLNDADCYIFTDPNITLESFLEYNRQIELEYSHVFWADYVEARVTVLEKFCLDVYPSPMNKVYALAAVEDLVRPRKIGIYVGSFNPFHIGHLNVVEQASDVFDQVVVVRAQNPDKPESVYGMPKETLWEFPVFTEKGTMTDIVDKFTTQFTEVSIIRGLRNGLDLVYETDYASWLKEMGVDNKVVYFLSPPELSHISSSSIRNMAKINPAVHDSHILD